MKKITSSLLASIVLSMSLVTPSFAQKQNDWPQPTPEQIEQVADGVSAMLIGWAVLPVVVLTGKQKEFCDFIGGKYDPQKTDICPGGHWYKALLALKYLMEEQKK